MCIDFGISREAFRDEYQERKPLLIKGGASDIAFGWSDACGIFDRCNVADPSFKLSYDGSLRPKKEYVERYMDIGTARHRLIKPVVYDYMRKGATLIANRIKHEPKVSACARAVGEFTGRQVVSSAYAVFGEKSSFRSHWDTRDVFAVQLIGRKRWLIYEPTFELPLSTQQSKDYESKYPHSRKPYLDLILEAGDVLYVPRGWWHDPLPLGEGSFHLALGTFPAYVVDYLGWAMHQMQDVIVVRKSLDDWATDEPVLQELAGEIVSFMRAPENYERFMDEFHSSLRDEASLALEDFADARGPRLSDETGLRLRAHRARGLSFGYLIHDGRKMSLNPQVAETLRFISESPGVSLCTVLEHSAVEDKALLRQLLTDFCQRDILCSCRTA
ncbi:cupin-like domain-containing protein [Herbaspirillum sp. AP02]|uniref:JmjC domain-containing protein n=1 Tax=unclassified Herbaspirillum TaxID=2624150 RepID=UPI0015DA9453|nr:MULTISPECIES: cupin domain-containing protein [unclassified Herbaspirillum]MBG7621238.1 cupin-like domain-containing protein [Herbaspirillum sp. AP02]NZD68967.1 cupin-like domain-containing protein [Herbaspirillum sp. AP21]